MAHHPAQVHHYVPRFVLRNFLASGSDPKKEQVNVFDKTTGRGFTTAIRGIMAERRFHDFALDGDTLASFEGIATRLEQEVLPTYRAILQTRTLQRTSEERANLGILLAFQMLRVRSQRDMFLDMDRELDRHLRKFGNSIEELTGFEPATEDRLKRNHVNFIRESLANFSASMAEKDMVLMQAPPGRSFYLSDTPVSLHNSLPKQGIGSNLGIGVRGIEVYLPLSADLLLAAWCPSILGGMRAAQAEHARKISTMMLSPALMAHAPQGNVAEVLGELRAHRERLDSYLDAILSGQPVPLTGDNMDFNNSMQVADARRHVVCPKGDFALAREFMRQNPNATGRKLATRPS